MPKSSVYSFVIAHLSGTKNTEIFHLRNTFNSIPVDVQFVHKTHVTLATAFRFYVANVVANLEMSFRTVVHELSLKKEGNVTGTESHQPLC